MEAAFVSQAMLRPSFVFELGDQCLMWLCCFVLFAPRRLFVYQLYGNSIYMRMHKY